MTAAAADELHGNAQGIRPRGLIPSLQFLHCCTAMHRIWEMAVNRLLR